MLIEKKVLLSLYNCQLLPSAFNQIKQDAHTLIEASIQRLERHVQKLAHAAQVSLAERAFLSAECALLDN